MQEQPAHPTSSFALDPWSWSYRRLRILLQPVWILGTTLVLWKNSKCSQQWAISSAPHFFSQILCMQGLWRPAEGVRCPGTGILELWAAGLVLGNPPSVLNCLSRLCFFSYKDSHYAALATLETRYIDKAGFKLRVLLPTCLQRSEITGVYHRMEIRRKVHM